ncbi:hypothetical protein EIKCOROL_00452 [Eikenella corrodens ATCC 23834]|uniref:Uncharacterized protein n=1 Tax=Eikenella corrodens ATCC 23834 TaxID=546274 RepID=C0DSX9_EIKCO|nr:hypothetical protein EIKCOROL_00452 [Eikenella corrodens ATCC 23834]
MLRQQVISLWRLVRIPVQWEILRLQLVVMIWIRSLPRYIAQLLHLRIIMHITILHWHKNIEI